MSAGATLIFDLDGTLVDTAPDLLASLNVVLARIGHREVAPAELRSLVGHGVRKLFERAFAETGADVPADTLSAYCDEFLVHYRANIARFSRPFAGVNETLTALKRDAYALGVCTNKPQDLSELLLAELDLTRYFGGVLGAGKARFTKPDARHILDLIETLGGDAARAVMIGDSPVDVAAARAANIPVIVLTYGYTPIPARELGADAIADDFAQIPAMAARLLAGTRS